MHTPAIPARARRPRRRPVASNKPASASKPEGFASTVAAAPSAANGIASLADVVDQRTTAVAAVAAATGTSVMPAATYVANTPDENRAPTARGGMRTFADRSVASCRASTQTAARRPAPNDAESSRPIHSSSVRNLQISPCGT
jgi:hypothetical protein